MFARPRRGMPCKGELLAVRRIAGPRSPIGLDGSFDAAFHWNLPQREDAGKGAIAPQGSENDPLAIGRPAHYVVVRAMKRELPRLSTGSRDHVDVIIARTIRRERDP